MICRILDIPTLVATAKPEATFILHHLTRPESDFSKKLTSWLYTPVRPGPGDGHIAIVLDHGEVVGWARTERWTERFSDGSGLTWDTLEAFVARDCRSRGVAAFAAAGLYASTLHDTGCNVAVFAPSMLMVAKRAGLLPTLFERDGRGGWRES